MLGILDFGFVGYFVPSYLDLLFGEFGQLTGTAIEEFERVLAAVRGAAEAVLDTNGARDLDDAALRLRDAALAAYRNEASWDPASQLAGRIKAIVEQVEYSLGSTELLVFTTGRMLGAWGFREAEDRSQIPRDRTVLVQALTKSFGGSIPDAVTRALEDYDRDPEAMRAVHVPDRIYQELRRSLLLQAIGLTVA